MEVILSFRLEKETKGALQYKEVDEANRKIESDYVVGTLYVRKSAAIARSVPQKLSVTIKVG